MSPHRLSFILSGLASLALLFLGQSCSGPGQTRSIIGAAWYGQDLEGIETDFLWGNVGPGTFALSVGEWLDNGRDYLQLYDVLDEAGIQIDLVRGADRISLGREAVFSVFCVEGCRGYFVRVPEDQEARMKPGEPWTISLGAEREGWTWLVPDGLELVPGNAGPLAGPGPEPAKRPSQLEVAMMQDDFNQLVETLRSVHPDTTQGFSSDQRALIASIRRRIDEDPDRTAFFFLCNELVTSFKDGHTALWWEGPTRYLDLSFVWTDEGIIIDQDGKHLSRGDKVLRIGGLDSAALETRLAGLISSENVHWRREMARTLLVMSPWLDHLGLPGPDGSVELLLDRSGKESVVTLRPAGYPGRPSRSPWVRYRLWPERNLGVLTLDSCRTDAPWESTVNAFFREAVAAGIGNIALDLRRNNGGDSRVMDAFLAWLPVDSYRNYGGIMRGSRIASEQHGLPAGGIQSWQPGTSMVNHSLAEAGPYGGTVYVITGPATFSSAIMFATVLSDNGLATTLGEPTGNSPSQRGYPVQLNLAWSGFGLSVSHTSWLRPRGDDAAPTLVPDIPVPTRRSDITAGRDSQLEALFGLVAGKVGKP